MAMRHRRVGSSDLEASVIGRGALNFGNPKRVPDRATSVRIIHAALDAGVNYIDTADAYTDGESEIHVGRAIAGRRDEVTIATKFKLSDYPAGDPRAAMFAGEPRFAAAVEHMDWASEGLRHRFTIEGDEVVVSAPADD